MALSTFFIIVVGWYQPLESAKANGIALFSECVTLCILYIMMTFTDVNEPETRYEFGSVLIGLLFVYQGIRIAAMLHESCKTLQNKLKERIIKRLYKKSQLKFRKWTDEYHEKTLERLTLRKKGIELKYITNDTRLRSEIEANP